MRTTTLALALCLTLGGSASRGTDGLIYPTERSFAYVVACGSEKEARKHFDQKIQVVREQETAFISLAPCYLQAKLEAKVFLVESWDGAAWGVKVTLWSVATYPRSYLVEAVNVPGQ